MRPSTRKVNQHARLESTAGDSHKRIGRLSTASWPWSNRALTTPQSWQRAVRTRLLPTKQEVARNAATVGYSRGRGGASGHGRHCLGRTERQALGRAHRVPACCRRRRRSPHVSGHPRLAQTAVFMSRALSGRAQTGAAVRKRDLAVHGQAEAERVDAVRRGGSRGRENATGG